MSISRRVVLLLCGLLFIAAVPLARISLASDTPIAILLVIALIGTVVYLAWGNPGRDSAMAAMWALGAVILFSYATRSPHLFLDDSLRDYGAMRAVITEGSWHPASPPTTVDPGQYDLASASVVPAMIALALQLPVDEYVFRLIYPGLFSIVVVVIFILTRRFVKQNWAAASGAGFFVAQPLFGLLSMVSRVAVGALLFSLLLLILLRRRAGRPASTLASAALLLFGLIPAYYNAAFIIVLILWSLTLVGLRTTLLVPKRVLALLALLASVVSLMYYFSGFTSGTIPNSMQSLLTRPSEAVRHLRSESSSPGLTGAIPQSWGPAVRYVLGLTPGGKVKTRLELLELLSRYTAVIVIFFGVVHIARSSLQSPSKWMLVGSVVVALLVEVGVILTPGASTIVEMSTPNLLASVPLAIAFGFGAAVLSEWQGWRGRLAAATLLALLILYSTGIVYQANAEAYYDRVGVSEESILSNRSLAHDKFFIWDEDVAGVRWLSQYGLVPSSLYGDYAVRYFYVFANPQSWSSFPRYKEARPEEWSNGYILLRSTNNAKRKLWIGWAWRDPGSMALPRSFASLDLIYSNGSAQVLRGDR